MLKGDEHIEKANDRGKGEGIITLGQWTMTIEFKPPHPPPTPAGHCNVIHRIQYLPSCGIYFVLDYIETMSLTHSHSVRFYAKLAAMYE